MSFVRTMAARRALRTPTFLPTLSLARSSRPLSTTSFRATQTGYGDPADEKKHNETPLPSSTPDPQPAGQGKGPSQKSGTTDPEVGSSGGKTGNAGGKKGAGSAEKEGVSDTEIRETKKIGEDPKKEEVGGAGPIGG